MRHFGVQCAMGTELMWPLLFVMIGLLLLIAEVFIPSGGVIGLLALGMLGVGLWRAFAISTTTGLRFSLGLALVLPVTLVVAVQLWPKTPMARRIFLAPPDPEELRPAAEAVGLAHLLGQYGRALTPLRPSGAVDFEGRRLDALAEGGTMIPRGALVRAVQVRAGQVVVRQAEGQTIEELAPPPPSAGGAFDPGAGVDDLWA